MPRQRHPTIEVAVARVGLHQEDTFGIEGPGRGVGPEQPLELKCILRNREGERERQREGEKERRRKDTGTEKRREREREERIEREREGKQRQR